MPVPFLSTLSAAARMAYPAIVGGVRRGLSSRAISGILQRTVGGIRRSTLLNIMARSRSIWHHGEYLRGLRRGQRFNPLALPEALTPITRDYAINLVVSGTSTDTGLPTHQYITLAMDQTMSRQDMEELAMRIADEGRDRYGMESESAAIIEGVRAGEAGIL